MGRDELREAIARMFWNDRLRNTYLMPVPVDYDELKNESLAKIMSLALADMAITVLEQERAARRAGFEEAMLTLIEEVELRAGIDEVNRYAGDHWDMAVEEAFAAVMTAAGLEVKQ